MDEKYIPNHEIKDPNTVLEVRKNISFGAIEKTHEQLINKCNSEKNAKTDSLALILKNELITRINAVHQLSLKYYPSNNNYKAGGGADELKTKLY